MYILVKKRIRGGYGVETLSGILIVLVILVVCATLGAWGFREIYRMVKSKNR